MQKAFVGPAKRAAPALCLLHPAMEVTAALGRPGGGREANLETTRVLRAA
jgi:hypothetical protein